MKRSMLLLVGCLSAGWLVGCAGNQRSASSQSPRGNRLGGAAMQDSTRPDRVWNAQDPPINAKTHFAAGQLAEAEHHYAVAATQYEQACKAQPDNLWAEYRLGVVYSHMKVWPKAITAWRNYIASSNGAASAWSNLGFTYELMGDSQKAEEAYKNGVARDGTCQPCRVNYGLLLARNGRIPEAVQQFSAVLTPAEVHYNLASVFEQQGRTKLARAEFEMALKLDPQMNDARNRMAAINFSE